MRWWLLVQVTLLGRLMVDRAVVLFVDVGVVGGIVFLSFLLVSRFVSSTASFLSPSQLTLIYPAYQFPGLPPLHRLHHLRHALLCHGASG